MKVKVAIMMAGLLLIGIGAFASGKKTEKFKVSGVCGMCESRIEKTAKAVTGVEAADYDLKAKKLEVTFDESKTSVETIQKAIAAVGHDTGKFIAEDKVYNALPGCCHYRK
jgi:copper chaperone CopZ